jgi:DNA-binding CsgD family transcriptional regulator/MFS family permease
MLIRLFKPNGASFGYAVFLAVNATSIWGGAFPLLPMEFQTFNILVLFSLVESLTFWGMLIGIMSGVWFFPWLSRRPLALPTTILVFFGSVCLIAPLYLTDLTIPLVVTGAFLLGSGSAAQFALWQQVFASQQPEHGNLDLMVGTVFSAVIYALLHVIPIAVSAFCIAFVAIPLAGLCLAVATRTIDFAQPMFEDPPRQHQRVYRNTIRLLWRGALCVGAFGFSSGVARALALNDPSTAVVVNLASMAGALVSALLLIVLWQRYTFCFGTEQAFRTIFPLIVTAFLFLPFLGTAYLRVFAGVMYMFFAFALMVMVIQSAQTSRDHGINPLFIYGFFAMTVYGLQSVGFLTGYISTPIDGADFSHLAILALLSVWFLGLTLYFVRGQLRLISDVSAGLGASIEFIALRDEGQGPDGIPGTSVIGAETRPSNDRHYRDRFALQCACVGQHFRLTAREIEVMELIARGNSVARIAEELVVSDNTIRTHSKRLYVKLGVHKRQEILDLLKEME